jgi:hypothetical protein
MCFSSSASFGAGAVLSIIGVISIKKTQSKSHVFFAAIPFIFGIQQISEGFLWMALTNSYYESLTKLTTYIFLFFAQVVWPFWVPLSVLLTNNKQNRKKISKLFLIVGIIVSVYLAFCLFNFPVKAEVVGLHISYIQYYPKELSIYTGIFYLIATIFPPFISELKGMKLLSFAILISYIITFMFFEHYVVSVWCFFASIISLFVLNVIIDAKKTCKPHIIHLK